MEPAGFHSHDHDACISDALSAAEAYCDRHQLRLTPARRRVLEILLEEHKAMGAYDVLERMKQEGLGSQPPVAYRCLDFLVTHGFAHRIERLNAFIACAQPHDDHLPVFLICRLCDSVAETGASTSRGGLVGVAKDTGFKVEQTVVEAIGVCPECQTEGTPA